MTGFYYPASWIGFGGEDQYGRGTDDQTIGNTRVRNRLTRHVGVFGPELSGYAGDRVRLFFHPLAGFAKERMRTSTSTASSTIKDTNFATQLGGGMDYRLTRRFVFRVFQFHYSVSGDPAPGKTMAPGNRRRRAGTLAVPAVAGANLKFLI